LKDFGFGQRVMETRILIEVEEMINKVREMQGRPFDVRQLTMSCVVNVIMNILFGQRFDHSDPAFQQLISDYRAVFANFSMALELFPALHILPYYRKRVANYVRTSNSVSSFVDRNVADCSQVRNAFFRATLRKCGICQGLDPMCFSGSEPTHFFRSWVRIGIRPTHFLR